MYKVIGTDNVEYGPVGEDKIREWLRQGRVNLQTRVQLEGSAGWKTLAELPNFADLQPPGGAAPPILPATPPIAGKTSGLAIASLVLGILAWVTLGITALPGLVVGIIALVKISRSQGALRGNGFAVTGTILSGVFVFLLPILAALLLPALAQAKSKAQSIQCMNNMKQLALGGIMYAGDNKDRLPDADHWCDALGKYVPNTRTFQCPAGNAGKRCHYAFNAHLAGVDTKSVSSPSQTVLMFEADGGWNLSGGPELLLKRPRHSSGLTLVFADGHCEAVREARLQSLRWEP